eukprot:UN01320
MFPRPHISEQCCHILDMDKLSSGGWNFNLNSTRSDIHDNYFVVVGQKI